MTAIRPDIVLRFKFVSKAAGGVVMLIGLSVALSWICHAAGLGRPLPSLLTVSFSTALSLILCGVALLCLQDELRNAYAYPFAMACASAIVMIGFVTLIQGVFGWHFELVPLLRNTTSDRGAISSITMGFNTALCLTLLGWALLLLGGRRFGPYTAQLPALAAITVAFAAFMGHAYSIESLYSVATYAPIALHSSIAFILVGVGIVCARPEQGLMAVLGSHHMGSKVARRLLPAAVLIPLVNGLLELRGERLGSYSAEFGSALVTTSNIVLLGALIWWTAT